MFLKDIEGMPASQIAFLKAVSAGECHFNARDVTARYGLGTPNTITKNKRAMVQKDLLEKRGSGFAFVDPLFALWFRREYS
ncbi:MAG: hypothetical protein J6Z14_00450 [Prevotella sp.]|nr:hypothetical protein [Prevotella sp.]